MVPLIAAFAVGFIPVGLILLMMLAHLDPPARRRALRHPILEARARLADEPPEEPEEP